jgi:hypothetical protein
LTLICPCESSGKSLTLKPNRSHVSLSDLSEGGFSVTASLRYGGLVFSVSNTMRKLLSGAKFSPRRKTVKKSCPVGGVGNGSLWIVAVGPGLAM